jgi:predicted phage replisome organizer
VADVQWIKLYIDMFDKRKIKKVRRLPAGNDLLLIWIMLLAMAGKCNAGGMIYITESVPFTEEDLADELDFEIGTIKLALQAFENLNMITTSDDGFIEVIGWEEYQNVDRMAEIREYNRLAQQRSREKKKLLQGVNDNVNDMSMTCQRCHDIEEELEEDKEKEIHSFNHSIAQGEDEFSTEFSTEHDPEDNPKMKYMQGKLGEGVVFMSDEQFHSLLDILSLDELHKYFEIVVNCEKQGKCYTKKTHYQAILDMAMKDRAVRKKGV